MSTAFAGFIPALRVASRTQIMSPVVNIDFEALKRAIIEETAPGGPWSKEGLSKAAGGNRDLVRDLLRKGSGKLRADTVVGLAKAMKRDLAEFVLAPVADEAPAARSTVRVLVSTIVEAGVWREWDELPPDDRYWVSFDDEQVTGQIIGARVEGRSMELRFPPGTDLECVLLIGSDETIESGDYVIVARHRAGLVEKTVKRIDLREDGNWELACESTLPEFQERIFIGQPDFFAEPEDEVAITNDEIRVVAKVRNAKQSFVKRRRVPIYSI